jgi:hypothetical protein
LWLAGASLVASPSAAQALPPAIGVHMPDARVWADAGWDPTWLLAFGAGSRAASLRSVRLDVEAAAFLPIVLLRDARAWQLSTGVSASFPGKRGLGVSGGLYPDLRSAMDSVASTVAFGSTVLLRPGWYGRRWTAALDLAWSAAWLTHVSLRSPVNDLFHDRFAGDASEGPRNGWYPSTSHRVRVGATGGIALSNEVALHAALGFAYTPKLTGLVNPPYGPLPFYTNLGGAYRW